VTVCIAAICEGTTILGASDRMLTAGDVEFEPDLDSLTIHQQFTPEQKLAHNSNAKIFAVTNYIATMLAGDSGLQTEIMTQVYAITSKRIFEKRDAYWSVEEVCRLYVDAYNSIKVRQIQQDVFGPFGLDKNTFISRQNEMSVDFIGTITDKIRRFEHDYVINRGVETIVVGLDMSGFNSKTGQTFMMPRLFTIHDDSILCCDSVGFASVGLGMRHASSQFMLAGHTRLSSMPETLLLTYLAKKRSEVAPGVGKGTDMFAIGPSPAPFVVLNNVPDLEMDKIDAIFRQMETSQKKAFISARGKIKSHIQNLFKKRQEEQETQQLLPTPNLTLDNPTQKG
jgi:hypothetical protein